MLLALFYLQLCKVVVAQIGKLFGCMRINDFGIGRRRITRQQKEKRVEERYKTKEPELMESDDDEPDLGSLCSNRQLRYTELFIE